MDVNLRHLRHARALAEHGHFGRAARALRITQPALSRSIAQVEREVGTRLFERGANGAEPTDAGRLLLEHAADLLNRAADLGREFDALKGLDSGELHVGAGTYPSELLVGNALAALLRQHPGVRARVVIENVQHLIPLLRRRELDIVIGDATLIAGDPEFRVTELAPRQGYFVGRAGHPLLNRPALALTDIMAFPLVATSRLTPALLAPFVRAAGPSVVRGESRPRSVPSISCESLSMMKTIVGTSDAIAILPLNVVAAEVAGGTLAVLPLVEPWLRGDFALIRLARRTLPPTSEKFWQLLLEADANLSLATRVAERSLLRHRKTKRAIASAPR